MSCPASSGAPRTPRPIGSIATASGILDRPLARAIVLTNQKGAVLELSGTQVGLMANADLSGLAITMR